MRVGPASAPRSRGWFQGPSGPGPEPHWHRGGPRKEPSAHSFECAIVSTYYTHTWGEYMYLVRAPTTPYLPPEIIAVKQNLTGGGFYGAECWSALYSSKKPWASFWRAIQLPVDTFYPLEVCFPVLLR